MHIYIYMYMYIYIYIHMYYDIVAYYFEGGATVAGSSLGIAAARAEPREAAHGPGSANAWAPNPFLLCHVATALGLTGQSVHGKKQRSVCKFLLTGFL